ncbi:MAG: FAD-dependent oxidoreductase, partial [Stellaceae bacterium]
MTSLGVRAIRAEARFLSPREIAAGAATVTARRIVIATGAAPYLPPLAGLDRVPYRTSDTIFEGRDCPEHLIVVGGGATGLELAAAHGLLGARVTLLEAERVLGGTDPELAALLAQSLRRAGLAIQEGARAVAVVPTGDGIAVTCAGGRRIEGSHLLIAAGRRAALASLDLAKAGIVCDSTGALVLDRRLRTSNRRAYAMGDAAGVPHSVQRAAYHAGIVIRNALFRWPVRADERALPSAVHTVPEFAAVGLGEAEARARHPRDLAILRWPFFDSDRAQIEGAAAGLVKIMALRNGRVLGAQILGEAAGEAIGIWALAISAGSRL